MKQSKSESSVNFHHLLPFSISVFLGAFLLFQVQPIISKYILPWFGGSSSVWVTSVLFFEVLLLFGYFYAYIITKLPLRKQVFIHSTILSFVALIIILLFLLWHTPITPPISYKPPELVPPVMQVFLILTVSVGLPYFMLSTTSSLLQRWYSQVQKKNSPYRLYALSNAGSLIGILSYPFLIEIFLPLRYQGVGWAIAFLLYSGLLLWISRLTIRHAVPEEKTQPAVKSSVPFVQSVKDIPGYWIILPFLSSVILLATTAKITQAVAPVPFLWLIPLGLYLLSFILCFDSSRWYWRWFYPYAFIASALGAIWIAIDMQTVVINFLVYTAFLFSSFMLLHGELYVTRPIPEKLNLYYFLIALGGAVGGVAVAVIAPLIFNDFWEFFIAIFLVAVIAILVINENIMYVFKKLRIKEGVQQISRAAYFFVSLAVLFGGIVYFFQTYASDDSEVTKMRNFYGTISVLSNSDDYGGHLTLYNGDISHGSQFMSKNLRTKPTQYYGPKSGAGLAITGNKKRVRRINAMNIGVVGLGVGTLAAYGEKGDKITFYEINPSVVEVANNDFFYLRDSKADVDIVIGDARLSMEKEVKERHERYNVLLIDAFTDDAIPVHLLTKEAFAVYLALLDENNGILAIHISNRYLDLFPVIRELAGHYGLTYAYIESDDDEYNVSSASWVLLAKNPEALSGASIQEAKSTNIHTKHVDLWTDDYSNLFQVLYLEQ